jgi:hypothetical protein
MSARPFQRTVSIPLPGQQRRVKELILYIAKRCEGARYFGAIKLNKILWKADFTSYADRRVPITGREYRRRKFGPALFEMPRIHADMLRDGLIKIEHRDFGDDMVENRTVALAHPDLSLFAEDDIRFVDSSIQYYWEKTGSEASDDSHGVAWTSRLDGDPMPYELAFLSDEGLDLPHLMRAEELGSRRGWLSR